MINWVIGIVIFVIAGRMLYKFIQKSKEGKCPSCSSDCSCSGDNCIFLFN
ncbi:FeoB-associated Cys-rich membrane protein [Neobacillus drentensis]|nr:FeoB-associated Cys-rich membrane protein [Neobacillus drentensis]